jgi:hypothetical protein
MHIDARLILAAPEQIDRQLLQIGLRRSRIRRSTGLGP